MGRKKGSKNKNTIINITKQKTNNAIEPIQLFTEKTNIEGEKILEKLNDIYFCMQFSQQTSSELCLARASNKNLHFDFRISENKICNRCIADNKHVELKELIIKSNKIIPDILKPICENTIIETMITIDDKTYRIEGI